jgi:hypothetical protein
MRLLLRMMVISAIWTSDSPIPKSWTHLVA